MLCSLGVLVNRPVCISKGKIPAQICALHDLMSQSRFWYNHIFHRNIHVSKVYTIQVWVYLICSVSKIVNHSITVFL